MLKKAILLSQFIFLCNSVSYADSEVACDTTCPSGQVMSSFADGNDVTCVCVPQGQMDPTVEDPNVPSGEDPDNTH